VRAAVAAAAALVVLAAAPAAFAHAMLVRTEPPNDAVVRKSPAQIVLHFSEPVETAFGSVRVYDSSARQVDVGRVIRPERDTVTVRVVKPLPRDTYTVAWRVVSADSHPVHGAFVFHVGSRGTNAGGVAAQVISSGTPKGLAIGFAVVRFLDFALVLLCVGGASALAFVLLDSPGARRPLLLLLGVAAAALATTALLGIVFQGATAGGFGLVQGLHWNVFDTVLGTRFGVAWAIQAAVAAALAVVAVFLIRVPAGRERLGAAGALALAVPLAITPAASGHSSVSGSVAMVADVTHVIAAAVWTGGLAFVVVALLLARADRWPLASRAVPRFSTLAVAAVAVIIPAGLLNAYEEVRAWSGLWDTAYGQLLLVKMALVLPILGLGAYNNRISVPRLRAGIASVVEQRRFLRSVGGELAIVALVVAVTAVLVAKAPARAYAAPSGPYSTTTSLGPWELDLVVDPAVTGRNEIHLYLLTHQGQPARPAEVDVRASQPDRGIGPLRLRAVPAGPGHVVVPGAQFPIAGTWQLQIAARRGQFTQFNQTLEVPIREEGQ
jgi:copper transport protein